MLKKLMSIKSQKGATMIEYALIASLISIAAISVLDDVGAAVLNVFTAVETAIAPAD